MSEPFDYGGKRPDGQHERHPGLPVDEIAKGFVRPLRLKYKHLKCGVVTQMPRHCAETYARQPNYYGSTFCCGCGGYFPVGENGEFVWENTNEKVGT